MRMTMDIEQAKIINQKSKIKNLPWRWILVIAILAFAALLPLLTNNSSTLNLLFLIYLFVTLSQSWNILAGFAGQISLGHAAFFGIGALVMRMLWFNGMFFLLALVAAGLVAALFALLIGIPTFRLRGVYFSIGTLALAEALRITVGNVFSNITTMPAEMIAAYDLTERYYLALGVALVTMLTTFFLLRSRVSLGLFAIREDEDAAQATGVRLLRHKLFASGVSSFFAGLAGAVFAYHQVSYYPAAPFAGNWSFDPLLITFVGGVGTLIGPVLGALFFVLVREQLALALGNLNIIIFGILFIVVVLALPGGLMDVWEKFKTRLAKSK